jgi:hypothetical protein
LPLWNWHVVGVDGFFGTTAEILDGWPTFVEDDVSGWIANTQGKIGFWSYTVVEELAVPEPSGLLLAALGALALLARRQRRQNGWTSRSRLTWVTLGCFTLCRATTGGLVQCVRRYATSVWTSTRRRS